MQASQSYARARVLAERLHRRARQAGQVNPNLFDTYLILYEIGQRNGLPMNRITAAIVSSGYVAINAAYKIGHGAVSAISHLASNNAMPTNERDPPPNPKRPRLRGPGEGAGTSDDVNTIEDADMDADFDNAAVVADAQRSGTSAARTGRTDGSETGVDPFYAPRLRPFNDTQNAILPYYYTGSQTLATGTGALAVKAVSIRLNSIYDVLATAGMTYIADPTPAAQVSDGAGNIEIPILRNFWSNIYRYWTVIECRYKVRFWVNDANDQEADIWCYHHGQQAPPLISTETTPTVIWSKYRRLHRHAHYKTIRSYNSTATEKGLFNRDVVFTGKYHMGHSTVHNDVAEDEYKETWHGVNEIPSLVENASFIMQRSQRSASSVALTINYDIEVVFHVQWKDLESKFQYMEPGADETFTNFIDHANL